MVKKTTVNMIKINIDNILDIHELGSEYEFEMASSLFLQLGQSDKKHLYTKKRDHLKLLIENYEKTYWSPSQEISDEQMDESDAAEKMVRLENEFKYKRKLLIKSKLKQLGINQNKLSEILGHSKTYTSELINGLRPFSREDIVIINRLFGIDYQFLIPSFIKQDRVDKIRKVLNSYSIDNVKFKTSDLENILANEDFEEYK